MTEPKRKRPEEGAKEGETSAKIVRKFGEKWKTGREWLHYEAATGVMFCSVCRTHAKEAQRSNSFVVGNKTMKLETIREHEGSRCHGICQSVARAQSEPLFSQPAVAALTCLSDETRTKLQIMFRTAHAIAKKGRPFTDFEWMCE